MTAAQRRQDGADAQGHRPVPAPQPGPEAHPYSRLILGSFVALYVELPPLQNLVAFDAGDDHHQALHQALAEPL